MTRDLSELISRATIVARRPTVLVADAKRAEQVAEVDRAVALVNKLVGPLQVRMADGSLLPPGIPATRPYTDSCRDANGNRACVEIFRAWVRDEKGDPVQPKNLTPAEAAELRALADRVVDLPEDWHDRAVQAEPIEQPRVTAMGPESETRLRSDAPPNTGVKVA